VPQPQDDLRDEQARQLQARLELAQRLHGPPQQAFPQLRPEQQEPETRRQEPGAQGVEPQPLWSLQLVQEELTAQALRVASPRLAWVRPDALGLPSALQEQPAA
jgi:hypothetical protein